MNTELIANLTEIDEIELIYATSKVADNKTYLNYTIICDVDNIVSKNSLIICKRIIATMSVITELLTRRNIIFSYTIKTSEDFERTINENHKKLSQKLATSEILYSKDSYYLDLIEEAKEHTKTKRA